MSPFRWKIEAFSLPFSDVSCASRGVYYVGTLRAEASLLGRSMCEVTGELASAKLLDFASTACVYLAVSTSN